MRACKNCKDGIVALDPDRQPYIVCALIPPEPVVVPGPEGMMVQWVRPSMRLEGWCGQFSRSWRRLIFGHGAT